MGGRGETERQQMEEEHTPELEKARHVLESEGRDIIKLETLQENAHGAS